jgi:D-glycero-D-manno-heptose 1,7-bisphosphate phosphatase
LTSRQGASESGALFLDRDGVLNRKRHDHVKSWEEFEFLPGVLETLRDLHSAGVRVIVVTNQSVVGRGLITEETLLYIHSRFTASVAEAGGRIEHVYACIHRPEAGCDCRKPNPGLLTLASRDRGVPLQTSVMVGDADSDVEAARRAGCVPVLIAERPPPGLNGRLSLARDLADAAELARLIWAQGG